MANEQNFRSFMELDRALDKDDQIFLKITLQGRFFNADKELKTVREGLSVVHCSMMITGQEDYIARYMGNWKPEVNEKGSAWVQVSFFNKTAERFLKFAAAYPDATIVVTGPLLVNPYTSKKDGQQHWGLSITGKGFYAPNISKSTAPAAPGYGGGAAAPSYGGAPAAPGGYGAGAPAAPAAPAAPGGYGAPTAPADTTAPAAPTPGVYGGTPAAAPAAPASAAPAPGVYGGASAAAPAAPAPAAPGGYGASQMPDPDANGFYNIPDADGELPF